MIGLKMHEFKIKSKAERKLNIVKYCLSVGDSNQ